MKHNFFGCDFKSFIIEFINNSISSLNSILIAAGNRALFVPFSVEISNSAYPSTSVLLDQLISGVVKIEPVAKSLIFIPGGTITSSVILRI
ncbi:MAG TPA: hypothetical protein VLA72_05735 [Anaerolineales bacterium]|nr:hypothetical protein [Anaerolineales bacterium]